MILGLRIFPHLLVFLAQFIQSSTIQGKLKLTQILFKPTI